MKYTSVVFIGINCNNMGRYKEGLETRFQHHVRIPRTVQHRIIY